MDELVALSQELPGRVSDRDFHRIADRMGEVHQFEAALALIDSAKANFPSAGHLEALRLRLEDEQAALTPHVSTDWIGFGVCPPY